MSARDSAAKVRAVRCAAFLSSWLCLTLASAVQLLPAGVQYEYDLASTVLVDGSSGQTAGGSPVGHRVVGQLTVANVWPAADEKLLQLNLKRLRLQTWSKKSKNGGRLFVDRKSNVDKFTDRPFFVHWKTGRVVNVYAAATAADTRAEENFKKGIAALFQFQLSDLRLVEHSTVGECNVTYARTDDKTVTKRIDGCISRTRLPEIKHPDQIWRGVLRSERAGLLTHANQSLTGVTFDEQHRFFTSFMHGVGASVSVKQHIQLRRETRWDDDDDAAVVADSVEQAVTELEKKFKLKLDKQDLNAKHEVKSCKHYDTCNALGNVVDEHHDSLLDSELGKSKSAYGAIKVIESIANSDTNTIKRVLTDKKNEDIAIQLYDLLGAALNENSHEAVTETLMFADAKNLNKAERYLWAASINFNPKIEIIQNLMSYTDRKLNSKKLEDTVYNTVTAMASRLVRSDHTESNVLLYDGLVVKTLERLEKCNEKDDECLLTYIRALANLKHPLSIDPLLNHALNGNRKISAYAMKTIKLFGPSLWNSQVLSYCNKIFFQLIKQQDSSTRTLALSILLESDPDYDLLKHVVKWLMVPEEAYEFKRNALELLKEIVNQNEKSANLLRTVLIRERLNHYGTMAQRGLSSTFSRKFFNSNNITGLVKTSQHIHSGVTKRGTVDIVFERDGVQYDLCNFGLFSSGLGYFTSLSGESNSQDTSDEANLPATAGLELIVFGVHIRPFYMFTSQGQLMGHVWSGTGSDRTPIFQGISQMIEHLEYLPLSNGITAELNLKGTLSLDIAGQVEMSLWNKNAQSVIEKNGGVSIQGSVGLDTDVTEDRVDFSLLTEGLLHVYSDAEFADKIAFCMKIILVETNVTTSIRKSEKLHGQRYGGSTVTANWTQPVSGRTFALNQLVNEFCNIIHSQ